MCRLRLRSLVVLGSCALAVSCSSSNQGDTGSPTDGSTNETSSTPGPSDTDSSSDTDSPTDPGTGTDTDPDTDPDTGTDTDPDPDPDMSTGEPGESVGVFDLTYYWVTYEGDFDPAPTTDIGTCAGEVIATVPTGFASALALEGSGKLLDDRIVNIGGCGCGGGYDCFAVLDPELFPWGQGSQGNALEPYRSIATDTSVLPFGTSLYAPDLDGQPLPNGETHDGCLLAADVGGGINGMHFDWFVGLVGNYQILDPEVPEQVELFEGGTICP